MKRDLGALAERPFDLLVVGGGIHGAACAWDAAERGLRVALVERGDFGAGTSWNSLKTIHGGLRYLQTLDFARMRASIHERRTLLRLAPELVRPLRFVVPTYGHGRVGREALGVALKLNDLVGFDRNDRLPEPQRLPPGRLLPRRELFELVPGLPERGVSGGALYWDAQVSSSERLLLAFLHAAVAAGAAVANYCEAVGLLRSAGGAVGGARVQDHAGGASFDLRAAVTLNCAGPDVPRVAGLAVAQASAEPWLRAYNLVLGRAVVGPHALGVNHGGRFLFAVPWRGVSMLGTDYEDPACGGGPAAFLEACAAAFPWTELGARDVRLVHSGLVPGRGGAAGLLSRPRLVDHARAGAPGLVSLVGVKYTTARGVAQRAVDLVFRRLGRRPPPCRTAETPLPLAKPLLGGMAASIEEAVRFAVRAEQALHLDDVVLRRTDLGTAGPPAPDDLERAAGAMAAELGWDAARLARERRALADAFARASLDPQGIGE